MEPETLDPPKLGNEVQLQSKILSLCGESELGPEYTWSGTAQQNFLW